jgi:DNA ligase (NAD+)
MYYAGTPVLSDDVFDRLAESTGYSELGSKQHEHIEKHYYSMFSLQKYYDGEGVSPKLTGSVDSSPKLDGAAISILYINGELYRVLTRGDGVEGTIVTEKFLATKLVPHTIPVMGIVQVTGEIAAPKHIENARNYAAGSLNLKDINEFKTRCIEFFAYGIQPNQCGMFHQDMRKLHIWGFNTVKDPELHNIFPCDGIVHRLDNYSEFYAAGYTSKYPRGAYALKERGDAVVTTILDVEWQVGKSGKITPVAILEPCKIGDKTIARATLNNIAFIRSLDIRVGDNVGVILGGEVIPKITHKVE